jgi:hypothetical protein
LADTVVEKDVYDTAYRYIFPNILGHITCVEECLK